MSAVLKPFRKAVISFSIEALNRPRAGTYGSYDQDLPFLPSNVILDESLNWLKQEGKEDEEYLNEYGRNEQTEEWNQQLENIIKEANRLNLNLPKSYILLMQNDKLRNYFRSPTACFFCIDGGIVPIQDRPKEYLLRFYEDSQGCCFWFLYFDIEGDCKVVTSDFYYPLNYNLKEHYDIFESINGEPVNSSWDNVFISENNFEFFLYRLWIEAEIWFYEYEEIPFTKTQQQYIDSFINSND